MIDVYCSAEVDACFLRQGNFFGSILGIVLGVLWWVGNIVFSRVKGPSGDDGD